MSCSVIPGAVETLPCSSCTAMCCGPVPISAERLPKIRDHLKLMSAEERRRLAKQRRGELDCGFLDKDSHRCTIYPHRPLVCELFGRVEGMECPKVGRLVQIIPSIFEKQMMQHETVTPIVATSDHWNWRTMDFD